MTIKIAVAICCALNFGLCFAQGGPPATPTTLSIDYTGNSVGDKLGGIQTTFTLAFTDLSNDIYAGVVGFTGLADAR